MTVPYAGEIRMVAFNFAPVGWEFCDGGLRPISEYEDAFDAIGTTYGGDGITTFALPDLQSRIPMHRNDAHPVGQTGGEATHTLLGSEMARHTHTAAASAHATTTSPADAVWAASGKVSFGTRVDTSMSPHVISSVGDSAAHNNMPPALALNFIICMYPDQVFG
jgi:microcystin-dependent protein